MKSLEHHDALKYIPPSGKTRYHSITRVKEALAKRKMDFCRKKFSKSSGNELDYKSVKRPNAAQKLVLMCKRDLIV